MQSESGRRESQCEGLSSGRPLPSGENVCSSPAGPVARRGKACPLQPPLLKGLPHSLVTGSPHRALSLPECLGCKYVGSVWISCAVCRETPLQVSRGLPNSVRCCSTGPGHPKCSRVSDSISKELTLGLWPGMRIYESALSLTSEFLVMRHLQKECVVVTFMGRVLDLWETLGQASKPSWF